MQALGDASYVKSRNGTGQRSPQCRGVRYVNWNVNCFQGFKRRKAPSVKGSKSRVHSLSHDPRFNNTTKQACV